RSRPGHAARRRWRARITHHRLAALQPHRDPARVVRRSKSGVLVPVRRAGADDARHVSPLPATACRGRAVDGGLRRVLAGDGQELARLHAGRVASCASFAVTLTTTLPLSALLIGQFSFASCTSFVKVSSSAPGTIASSASSLDTTAHASWTLSKRTVAVTFSRSGTVPFFASRADSAMAKQLACAAASSSSGLVLPSGASVRAAQDTGRRSN